jgi:hypothetical protein
MDSNTKCHLPIIIMNEFQQTVKATAKMSCSRAYVSKTETSRTGHPCAFPSNRMGQPSNINEHRQSKFGHHLLEDLHVAPLSCLSGRCHKSPRSSAKSLQQPCRTERLKCPFNIVVGEVREKQRTTNQPCKEMESSAILGRLVLPTCHFLLKTHP